MAQRSRSNLTRIVDILAAFDAENTPRGSVEMLDDAGIARSTGFALIRALVAQGWLERVDHGSIRLGSRAASLMFGPLEPGLALWSSAATLAAQPQRAQRQIAEPMALEPARAELARVIDTSRYAIDRHAKIGFANASRSNAWRNALAESMEYACRVHGPRISELISVSAEDDADLQLAQIDRLVADGIDLLIVSCPNLTSAALSDRLVDLARDGLPIVALDRRPRDPSSLLSFVTASDTRIGRITATWMVERLAGKGRVWMLSGVDGASPAVRRQTAALSVFSNVPGIVVEAVAYTNWTEAGGYAAIDRLLDQFGRAPEGVWCDSGLQGLGSVRRLLKAGAEIPAHTGGDLNGMYKLAVLHKLPFVAVDYPAVMGARAIDVALDILSGKPVRNRIEVAAPVVMPRGMETAGIKADIWAESHVRWDLPDEAILSQGPGLRAGRRTPLESWIER